MHKRGKLTCSVALKIQQTIEKPTKQVVYGQGDVPAKGHVVIPVTARVA